MPNCFGEILFANRKIYQECLRSLTFCHPVIFQFLIAAVFFVTDCKELKRAQNYSGTSIIRTRWNSTE